ncbi:hypothetical protein C5167_012347 [Papaver somniferum]|uniref:Uncharacterized protein n=1 Tax=Papaver somniferum TaxID=3469 RepID=A0A4Y7J0L5_PAPSO|nr:hypothetical protein C5167_012347 [Papaver somniferum]
MAGLMRAKLLKLSGELKSSIVPGIRWIHAVLDKHLKCLVVGDGRNNSLYSDNCWSTLIEDQDEELRFLPG